MTRLSWCLRVCPGAAGWDVQSLALCFPFTSLGAGRGLGASQGLWKHRPVPVWGSHRAHRCGMSPAGSGTWHLSPCPGHVPGVGGTSWVSCWVTTCTCACLPLPGALCCATAPSPHQRSEVIAPKLPFPAPALCKGLSAGAERSGFSSEVVSVGMRCWWSILACRKGLGNGEASSSGQTDTRFIVSLFGVRADERITVGTERVAFELTGNPLGACECSELCWGGAHILVLRINTVTVIKKIALCLGGFSLDVPCSL